MMHFYTQESLEYGIAVDNVMTPNGNEVCVNIYIGVSLQFLLFEHTDLSTGSFRVLYFPMPFRYTMSRLSLSQF